MTDTKQGGPEPVRPEALSRTKGRTGTFTENANAPPVLPSPQMPEWLEEDRLPPGAHSDHVAGAFW